MLRLAALTLVLAACVPDRPSLAVHVTDAAGNPLAGVVVAAVCDASHADGGAEQTAADGTALVSVPDAPTPCTVTASLARFDPIQVTGVHACPSGHTCDPLELALVQVLP